MIEADIADADLIELERLRSKMLQRIDIDLIFNRRHVRADRPRADLQQIGSARQQR